jgi:hypothetical protein
VTLVDTSVWVEHLRRGNAGLARLLAHARVLCHPFVVGEIACGRLTDRRVVLGLLAALPHAPEVEHDEALEFLERHRLAAKGLGWIDIHLLAGATLAGASLWTLDRALAAAASKLGLS